MKKSILLAFLLLAHLLGAQITDSLILPPQGGNSTPDISMDYHVGNSILQNTELLSSWAILLIGSILFAMTMFSKPMNRLDPEQHIKLIIVVLTVTASLYLIAYGFNSEQTAPAFGLLGTILGYILGKSSSKEKAQK